VGVLSFWQKGLGSPFLPYFAARIAEVKAGTALTRSGKQFSYFSRDGYASAYKYTALYQEKTSQTLRPGAMDEAWYEEFIRFLHTQPIRHNTVASVVKKTKGIQRRMCKAEKIPFPANDVQYGQEITTKVYCTRQEIAEMARLDLPAGLSSVRDAFIVQCYTGLRFSDLKRLLLNLAASTQQVDDGTFFTIRQQKTGADVVIPIATSVASILNRRGWEFPANWSIQYYNQTVKEVAKRAGLTGKVTVYFTRNTIQVAERVEKHLLVSSHTARRSFATNAYLLQMPVLNIMRMTGHKTEAAFMRYIRAEGVESAMSVIDHPFFQQ
jgi:integrase